MHKLIIIFTVLIAGSMLHAETLSGQDAEGSLLPEIDPQDIEIRSQYRARFPGLRRQPILGFSPGSRVYQVDPERSPFLEDRADIAAQLPVGELSRPEAPEYRAFPYADSRSGYGRFGAGNFVTPEAELYLNREIAPDQWLSGSVNHTSSAGHLDQNSSFRYLDAESRYRGKIGDRTVLGVSAGAQSDFNYLPLLEIGTPGAEVDPGRKSYTAVNAATRLQRYQNSIEHLDIGLSTYYNTIGLDEEFFGLTSDLSEWGVASDAGYTWAGERIDETYRLGTEIQAGGYELNGGGNESWHQAGLRGAYQRLFNYQTKLSASLGMYHIGDAADNTSLYVSPDITVEHYPSDYLTISANIRGKPEQLPHLDYHSENRFLLPDNRLMHAYNLKATAEVIIEPIAGNKIRTGISYQNSNNYPVFMRRDPVTGIGSAEGHYSLGYEDVTIQQVFAGMSVDLIRERIWFDVEGYFQAPRISDDR
ncbi:MAG: hypothetical protein WEC12_02715, partial [Balneolaceae bacterium]